MEKGRITQGNIEIDHLISMSNDGLYFQSKQYSLNMRPSRRTSGGSTLTTIEDFMTALPKSYLAWSLPINLHDPRFLVIDPQRGPDNNLLGTKSIHEIAETYFREYKRSLIL